MGLKLCVFLIFIKTILCDSCSETHPGECPNLEPVQDFDINKMLGTWYVIEKTCTTSQCMIYNISKTANPGEFKLESISENYMFRFSPIKRNSFSAVTLKAPSDGNPGKMTINYPFQIFGDTSFTVFATDYSNYAGIFACQKRWYSSNKQSAAILSRTRTLDKSYIEKIRSHLFNNQVNPFDLSILKQENCTNSISQHKWSSLRAELVRRAGNSVSDSVDYVADTGRAIYDKVSNAFEDVEGNAIEGLQNTVENGRKLTQNAYETVEEKVRNSGQNVRNFIANSQQNAQNAYETVEDKAMNSGQNVRNFVDKSQQNFEDSLQKNQL